MPGPLLALNRVAALVVAFVVIFVFIITTASLHSHSGKQTLHKIKDKAQSTANNFCNNDRPLFGKPTITDSLLRLYEAIAHPISSPAYTDPYGKEFEIHPEAPWWHEPLRNQVLIVDIDTRVPNKKNELWNDKRMNWEAMASEGDGGMVSAAFMNHFLYCRSNRLIHVLRVSNTKQRKSTDMITASSTRTRWKACTTRG
jgi:hypothetical protein